MASHVDKKAKPDEELAKKAAEEMIKKDYQDFMNLSGEERFREWRERAIRADELMQPTYSKVRAQAKLLETVDGAWDSAEAKLKFAQSAPDDQRRDFLAQARKTLNRDVRAAFELLDQFTESLEQVKCKVAEVVSTCDNVRFHERALSKDPQLLDDLRKTIARSTLRERRLAQQQAEAETQAQGAPNGHEPPAPEALADKPDETAQPVATPSAPNEQPAVVEQAAVVEPTTTVEPTTAVDSTITQPAAVESAPTTSVST